MAQHEAPSQGADTEGTSKAAGASVGGGCTGCGANGLQDDPYSVCRWCVRKKKK